MACATQWGSVTPDEFRQWRLRMGKLTIEQSAEALKISFSSARQFGDGSRDVPAYISELCTLKERMKIMDELAKAAPQGGVKHPTDLATLMAAAYIQARKKKSPALASTLNAVTVQEDMLQVLETLAGQGYTIHEHDQKPSNASPAPENNKKTGGRTRASRSAA